MIWIKIGLKCLVDGSKNYHKVLPKNQNLFNDYM
jgi:hypothetical protein